MNIENVLRNMNPEIASILGRSLDGREISSVDTLKSF